MKKNVTTTSAYILAWGLAVIISKIAGLASIIAPGKSLLILPITGLLTSTPLALGLVGITWFLLHGIPSTFLLPTLCATLSLSCQRTTRYVVAKKMLIHLLLPISCIAAFAAHPIGIQSMLYTSYWIIPMALGLASIFYNVPLFYHALTSTFIAHAIGSVLWLYAKPTTPEYWHSLISVVAVERLVMAAYMSIGIFIMRAMAKKILATNFKNIPVKKKYLSLILICCFLPLSKKTHCTQYQSSQANQALFKTLYKAYAKDTYEKVTTLLANGACVNTRDMNEATPLHAAVIQGNLFIVNTIIQAGAYIDVQDKLGVTPLHYAAYYGYVSITLLLIAHGANTQNIFIVENNNNYTESYYQTYTEIREIILGASAIQNKKNYALFQAMNTTQSINHILIKLLLELGAYPNITNGLTTPLHIAVERERTDLIETLLNYEANKRALNNAFQTPRDLAIELGFIDIAQLLA